MSQKTEQRRLKELRKVFKFCDIVGCQEKAEKDQNDIFLKTEENT